MVTLNTFKNCSQTVMTLEIYRLKKYVGIAFVFGCREGTNIEVRVEIEAQPRRGRQPSLSSVLSSRSLSAESLHHSHEPLCASQQLKSGDPPPLTETDNV